MLMMENIANPEAHSWRDVVQLFYLSLCGVLPLQWPAPTQAFWTAALPQLKPQAPAF
jgi:hypothetical protein